MCRRSSCWLMPAALIWRERSTSEPPATLPSRPGACRPRNFSRARPRHYTANTEAIENAYRVGSPVVRELAQHWPRYQQTVPAGKP